MSTLQASRTLEEQPDIPAQQHPLRRLLLLCLLLLCCIGLDMGLLAAAPATHASTTPFLLIWLGAFLPYLAACGFVLRTRPSVGRWQWAELGVILFGALLLRALFTPVFPFLSHDALRYLWDARVTLHGFSPYTNIPESKALLPLRDSLLYPNMGFEDVPTLYPPGAQAIYLVSYLLGGSSLTLLKTIFLLFDMATCIFLALLLKQRGLDMRRVLLYAWCPLVTVELVMQGHVDVLTITFSVLAILCTANPRRGFRILTGFFVAMATLTKIYPILLLFVVIRKRDYALLATCAVTILAFYTPYLILGHGNAFGFFSTYVDQHPTNQGILPLVSLWLSSLAHVPLSITFRVDNILDVLIAGAVTLFVLLLRLQERISKEAGFLILIGMIFTISSHVFSWYATAMLPWVALLIGPLWSRETGIQGKALAAAMVWYFASTSLISYFFAGSGDWRLYYAIVYDVTLVGLAVAAVTGLRHSPHWADALRPSELFKLAHDFFSRAAS
jgi:hypothetical protein